MKYLIAGLLIAFSFAASAQRLPLKARSRMASSGSAFAQSIADSTLSIDEREKRIFKEVRSGNLPAFYRNLVSIRDTVTVGVNIHTIQYFVLPDFLAIGSDSNYFYCPMRPALAQKIADLFKCSLPTRKISDRIYEMAQVKLDPLPIPPSKLMTRVPVFIRHSQLVAEQRKKFLPEYPAGSLVAGNKKDIVISNKIYTPDHRSHVVIYGWHQPGGKAIQPMYNGHDADWADYSHGVRLIQNRVWVDGKKRRIRKILRSPGLHVLLSDEGPIERPAYPQRY